MKKHYRFLALILMLFGINAMYAGIRVGNAITDPTTIKAGDKILMRAGRANNPNANPDEEAFIYKWLSALSDSLVWSTNSVEGNLSIGGLIDPYTPFTLEASNEKIKDQPTFYLKNDFNGKYLKYIYKETVENEDGEFEGSIIPDGEDLFVEMRIIYTEDKNAASSFAIALASEANKWMVNGAYEGEEQPEKDNIMICTQCKEYTEKEVIIALNHGYRDGQGWVASYNDAGAWFNLYNPITTNNSVDDLSFLYAKVAEINYIGGSGPGTYDPELVSAYNEAKAKADKAINNPNPDEATCKEVYTELEKAWLALAVLKAEPMKAGYYRVVSAYEEFYKQQGVEKAIYATSDGVMMWKDLDIENAYMGWEFIDRQDGTWIMKNMGTQMYVNSATKLSNDSTNQSITINALSQGDFNIIRNNGENAFHAQWHSSGAGKGSTLCPYPGGSNTASAWYIRPIPADTAKMFMEIGMQNKRDAELAALITTAQAKYNIGSSYEYDKKDSLLTSYTQLTSNAAQISNDEEYTNVIGPVWGSYKDGGGFPALLDGDKTTYFHSAWQGSIAEAHYLQIDLKENPVKTFLFKYIRRNSANIPTGFDIYATNDTLNEPWRKLSSVGGLGATVADTLSPGFDLDQAYQFIRIVVTSNNNNNLIGGFPMFALSELQLYKAALTDNCQNALIPEQANALKAAINEALKVETGKTTDEDIQKLQEAYDAYMAVLADPTELKTAYKNAQTIYNQAVSESTQTKNGEPIFKDPGTYSDENKAAFKAEMDKVAAFIDENDANGSYTKAAIEEQLANLENAVTAFKATIRWINAANEEQEGTWYHIAASKRYYDITGKDQDASGNDKRNGIIYVEKPDGILHNATLRYATLDSINRKGIDVKYAKWRFINLADTAYAIQNEGTKLYIGQKTVGGAGLSATPVAYKLSEIGYGTFILDGYNFQGDKTNPLHAQTVGQLVVYWDNKDLGNGSCWDIYTTDENRTEEGEYVEIDETEAIKNFMEVQAGKLYTMCYPVGIEYMFDSKDEQAIPTYGVTAISETELTLSPLYSMEPGQPFFYLGGNDMSLLKPNPTATDTASITLKLADLKTFAQEPLTVNGLAGNYYGGNTVPAGLGYLKETTKTTEGVCTERIQTIEPTTKGQELDWNSAYVIAGEVKNEEATAESITIKIGDKLDTAIKDAIMDAQQGTVNVFSIDGLLIKKNVKPSQALKGLNKGIYIIGNQKVIVQ